MMARIEIVTGVCVLLGVMGCSGDDTAAPQPAQDSSAADTSAADTQKADVGVVPDTSTGDTSTPTPETSLPDTAPTPDSTAPDAADASATDSTMPDGTVTDAALAETEVTDAAMADMAVVDQVADALIAANCGSSPYQVFDPLADFIVIDTPKTTVSVTANICPETTVDIPYMQQRTMSVQRNAPFFFIATQTGNLTNFSREFNVSVAAFAKLPYQAQMYPPAFPLGIDPGWDANTKAMLYVIVNASTGAGACSTKDGVAYSVPNHPEAVISYKNGGVSTSGGGDAYAWISLVTNGTTAAPEYVTITQTKAGCKVDLNAGDKLFLTGRAPIAINTVTVGLSGEVMNP